MPEQPAADNEQQIKQPTQPGEIFRRMQQDRPDAVQAPAMTPQQLFEQQARQASTRSNIKETQQIVRQEMQNELRGQGLGLISIPIDSLPTQGLFYPEGTRIYIRAASGAEIRHWSMTNEEELSEINDALDYIFERCVSISFPEGNPIATWKDVAEIDRLYLILAVRDLTFKPGENELKISISENEHIVVNKDNISFIKLDEKIMKYYNPDDRCFTFEVKNMNVKKLNFYLPSIGVTRWLQDYIRKKQARQEKYDQDFITVAPLLIKNYRGLNDNSYKDLIQYSMTFSNYEWALINKVRNKIEKSVDPKITYVDESGAEKETGLNFQGGLKAIFLDTLDEIDL